MALVLRSDKGSNLTASEVDANFLFVIALIDALSASVSSPKEITNIVKSGDKLIFYLTGGSSFEVDAPRLTLRDRGEWEDGETYYASDITRVSGLGLYLVNSDHISGDTFVADETDTDGNPLYTLLFGDSSASVVVTTSTDILYIDQDQANKYIRCINGTSCDVFFAAGLGLTENSQFTFRQSSTGPITITGDTAFTIIVPEGKHAATDRQGAMIFAKLIEPDAIDVWGDLADGTA